jgi:RNA polymerase sigma factor (sigma-70 family)
MDLNYNEDLIQKALVIILKKYKAIEFEKGIIPWAYTVLDNVIRGDYMKEIRRKNILAENKEDLIEFYGNKMSSEKAAEHQELIDEIWHALNSLSSKEKEVFQLKLKGHTSEEILNELKLKRNALDARVCRAHKKLRRILGKRGVL